ncbi:unnamed protein product [Moneuplotes crassus]|uniref:Uncharacterized protein n=1 Tax=Euplotes crassus TaxID=5936 RepID=A0AAD1U6T3_EUPCR|nr:unnamed protein product [Moneuplotes crassus]
MESKLNGKVYSQAMSSLNGIIFDSTEKDLYRNKYFSPQKRDYVKSVLNRYYSKNFQIHHHPFDKKPTRDLERVLHDNLTFMMTNLSYTNNENRFLDKVINWYKTKSGENAKKFTNSTPQTQQNSRIERKAKRASHSIGELTNRRYKQAPSSDNKRFTLPTKKYWDNFLTPGMAKSIKVEKVVDMNSLSATLSGRKGSGSRHLNSGTLQPPVKIPTSSSISSNISAEKKEVIAKLKRDIENRQRKNQKNLEKIRARLQDPEQLYMKIQKFNSRRQLQKRQIPCGLSSDEMREKNQKFYENLRNGTKNPWIPLDFKKIRKSSQPAVERTIKTSSVVERRKSQDIVENKEVERENPPKIMLNPIKMAPMTTNRKRSNTGISTKPKKMLKLRSTQILDDKKALEIDTKATQNVNINDLLHEKKPHIKNLAKKQVIFNDSVDSPSLYGSTSQIVEEDEEDSPKRSKFDLITPVKMKKLKESKSHKNSNQFEEELYFSKN